MLKRIRQLFERRGKRATSSPDATAPEVLPESAAPRGASGAPPPIHRGPNVVHRPIPLSDLDPDAVKIVQRLTRFDHAAYLVGGCVRDLLLERKPKDFDVGTSATPRQIKRLFRNCRIIGRRFRLAHIYFQNGKIIEVATFRGQDEPEAATPTRNHDEADLLIRDDNLFGTPEEDALRRDFTINSLFYDLNNETVLDHTDGLGDLRRRLVRTIGDPEIRFREDPIRILRAIKFAARLDLSIEEETLRALRRLNGEIPKAASPRILEEIQRFAREGAARRSFELLRDYGVLWVLLPELRDTYESDAEAWSVLAALLDGMDARRRNGGEVGGGEVFSALLLPVLAPRLGWPREGGAAPRGPELRTLIDDTLRPIALRLRLPRKDQETCRQVLATLARLVPPQRLRRGARAAIMRRDCFPVVRRMLELLAGHWGGAFARAHETWAEEPRGEAERATPRDEAATPARSRRRRRRGRRRASGAAEDAAPVERPTGDGKEPVRRQQAERAGRKPRVWDDDYFFSALPTVPELGNEEEPRDRYGAAALAARAGASSDASAADEGEAAEAAPERPRRRRRSRRRRRGGTSGDETGSAGSDAGDDDGDADRGPS